MAAQRVPMLQWLIQKGFLSADQANEATKMSQQTNSPIDKVIVQLGFAGEREVLQGKAQEQGLGFADLDRMTIDSSALNVVPERIVKNHSVIPVRKDGQTLYVAMKNSSNIAAIDDLRLASGCRVVPVLAVPGAIEDAIKKYYSASNAAPVDNTPAAAAAAPTNTNFAKTLSKTLSAAPTWDSLPRPEASMHDLQ